MPAAPSVSTQVTGTRAVGALVTAVLAIGISSALDAFFRLSDSWSVLYGSVASVAAFLYSIYLYAVSILIGAEVCAALSRPPSDTPAPPVSVQLRNALIGLFRHVDDAEWPPTEAPVSRGRPRLPWRRDTADGQRERR